MTRIEDVYRITKARYDNIQRLYELESELWGCENNRYVEMLRDEMNVLFSMLNIIKSEDHARAVAHLYNVDLTEEIYLVITEYIHRPYEAFIELEMSDLDQAKQAARVFAADDKPDGPHASRTFICKKVEWETGNYEEIEYKEETENDQ